jgi:hypothetical protein
LAGCSTAPAPPATATGVSADQEDLNTSNPKLRFAGEDTPSPAQDLKTAMADFRPISNFTTDIQTMQEQDDRNDRILTVKFHDLGARPALASNASE